MLCGRCLRTFHIPGRWRPKMALAPFAAVAAAVDVLLFVLVVDSSARYMSSNLHLLRSSLLPLLQLPLPRLHRRLPSGAAMIALYMSRWRDVQVQDGLCRFVWSRHCTRVLPLQQAHELFVAVSSYYDATKARSRKDFCKQVTSVTEKTATSV